MEIARLVNESCRTNTFGAMIYRWTIPGDLAGRQDYKLRLRTDIPESEHVSGPFRVSQLQSNSASKSFGQIDGCRGPFNSLVLSWTATAVVLCLLLLCFWRKAAHSKKGEAMDTKMGKIQLV